MHIPFCRRKCPYCSFYSLEAAGSLIDAFLDALTREASSWSRSVHSATPIRSLYIGGGTPTTLSRCQWERLSTLLENSFDLSRLNELTVEANPDSLMQEHLSFWKEWGVTRISLGVQSLEDKELSRLGRVHDSRKALQALDMSMEQGFLTSSDVIFTVPGQNLRSWHKTLCILNRKGVHHISAYQLSIEHGTAWAIDPPGISGEGYTLFRWAQFYLRKNGYAQYEISSFCRGTSWCDHNLGYWHERDFIGLGPSAWGFLKGRRYRNVSSLETYCRRLVSGKSVKEWSERLSKDESAAEAAILALRTAWGIDFSAFEERFGSASLCRILRRLREVPGRYLLVKDDSAALTCEGMRVANAIWERLLPRA